MQLLLFVLSEPEKLDDLLTAWENAGAHGATVLASTGLGNLRQKGMLRDDFPIMPGLGNFFNREETSSRTLFTLVEDDALIDKLVSATQEVVGDLSKPGTGILMVLPVSRALGLDKC